MAQQNPHRQGERRTRRPVYFDVFKVVATAFDVQPVATVPEENAFIYRHGNDITIAAQTSRFIKWDVYFDLPQLYVGMVIAGRVEGYQGALLKRCVIIDERCVNKGFVVKNTSDAAVTIARGTRLAVIVMRVRFIFCSVE